MNRPKTRYCESSDQNWDLIRDQGPYRLLASNGEKLFPIFYNKTIMVGDTYKQQKLIFMKGNLDE